MLLERLALQHFRTYTQSVFSFGKVTVIVGPNAIGKTNLIESIFLLATGKSFKSQEGQFVSLGESVAHVKAKVVDDTGEEEILEIIFALSERMQKKYLVNGVSRRRVDFAGYVTAVLFTPADLDLISGQPGNRRRFLDEVLEQVDREYRLALTLYTKALRQRNALLDQVQRTGMRNEKQFAYWDELLITNGTLITQKRESFIAFVNSRKKDFFPFMLTYDSSIMSRERLDRYKQAEVGAGVTLVGPQRDDVFIQTYHTTSNELVDVRSFASRGQQRLVTLELKLAQVAYLEEQAKKKPILLLDDIFSELDSTNIARVLKLLTGHQIIITTTHEEFVVGLSGKDVDVIKLEEKV